MVRPSVVHPASVFQFCRRNIVVQDRQRRVDRRASRRDTEVAEQDVDRLVRFDGCVAENRDRDSLRTGFAGRPGQCAAYSRVVGACGCGTGTTRCGTSISSLSLKIATGKPLRSSCV